jgi:diacylglycerol kinase (ATP)
MRVGVIINPISGRDGRKPATGDARAAIARRVAAAAGSSVSIELTRHAGHAAALAHAFVDANVDRVIAWGGDGTINEVAGPLRGTRIALGIVPSGSGDGLARSLGLRVAADAAFRAALTDVVAPIDVGLLGDRHFLNIAGVGFDAAVACAFNQRQQRGPVGYVTGGLTSVWTYRCGTYELDLDGEVLTGRRFLVAFANGRQYGNGIVVAPDANPSDGWLNAVIVADGSAIRQLWRARRLAVARLEPAEGVRRMRVRDARIRAERLVCHVDGETFEAAGELRVAIAPKSLLIAGYRDASSLVAG